MNKLKAREELIAWWAKLEAKEMQQNRPQNVYDIHPTGGQPTIADVHAAHDDSLGFLEPRGKWLSREEANSLAAAYDAGVSAGKRGAVAGIVIGVLYGFCLGIIVGGCIGAWTQ